MRRVTVEKLWIRRNFDMLNTFRDSTRFKSSFENSAADDEWQRAFFRVFFSKPLVGMKQMIRRWIDIIEAHLFNIQMFL